MIRIYLLTFLCLVLPLDMAIAADVLPRRPVIVVPGVMGSMLCRGKEILWGDLKSYTRENIKAIRLTDNFDLHRQSLKSCGIIDRVNVIPLFWAQDYYKPLIDMLKNTNNGLAYKEDEIHVFDYDWRLGVDRNEKAFEKFIEEQVKSTKFDVIAHSMGGLIAQLFATRNPNSGMHNLIMLGTPNQGSADIFRQLSSGFDYWPNQFSGGIAEIQKTILSFPAFYDLLPSYDTCCYMSSAPELLGANKIDIFDPEVWRKFSWLPLNLENPENFAVLSSRLLDARKTHMELMTMSATGRSEPYLFYLGNSFFKTWSTIVFSSETGNIIGHQDSPGDGTVTLYSATQGDISRARPALNEHAHLFLGDAALFSLQIALSDKQWKDAQNIGKSYIRSDLGKMLEAYFATPILLPPLIAPGKSFRFGLSLEGDFGAETFDNLGVTAQITTAQSSEPISLQAEKSSINKLAITGSFSAPKTPGPIAITIDVPGIQTYSLYTAVFSLD